MSDYSTDGQYSGDSHYGGEEVPPKSGLSPTVGLVLGIVGIVFALISLIPCVGFLTIWIAGILVLVGLILSIVAKGTAGIVLNAIGMVISIIAVATQMTLLYSVKDDFVDGFVEGFNEALEEAIQEGVDSETEMELLRLKEAVDDLR